MSQIDWHHFGLSRLSFLSPFEKSLPKAPDTGHLTSPHLPDQLLVSPGLGLAEARLPQLEGCGPVSHGDHLTHADWSRHVT